MDISQIGIMLFGAIAIILSQSPKPSTQRFACLFGVCGQPFWFWTTYTHQQWGIFIMCFLYSYGWLKGLWHFWIKPWLQKHFPPDDPFDDWADGMDEPPH